MPSTSHRYEGILQFQTGFVCSAEYGSIWSRLEGSSQIEIGAQRFDRSRARALGEPADQRGPHSTVNAHRAEFHCPLQPPRTARPSERSAAAELSSSSMVQTRPQPFGAQPRYCAQSLAHGDSQSGVATSASRADASSPLRSPRRPSRPPIGMKSWEETTAHGNSRSGVATSASYADASSPLRSPRRPSRPPIGMKSLRHSHSRASLAIELRRHSRSRLVNAAARNRLGLREQRAVPTELLTRSLCVRGLTVC